ncbi:MAG: hypothetical protein ISS55_00765 [Dehalococcoidales bacterium]|nr:hypothetical protein [Dehalococcoidales bacterium]
MTDQQRNTPISTAIWGTFLLFLGLVFLLQTTGVLPWDLWGTLWRFWPVVLVLCGAGILLRGHSFWLVSLVSVVVLGGCLGIALWQHGPMTSSYMRSETLPLGNLESAEVHIEFTAGRLDIGSLSTGSADLMEIDYEVRDGYTTLDMDFREIEDAGELRLSTVHHKVGEDAGADWRIVLTRSIPLSVIIRSVASDVDLNLRRLEVTRLTLDLDAGNCEVVLPSSAGVTSVAVDVNVANVEITVPDDVAARIQIDGGLSLIEVDRGRFPQEGDYFQSPGFESAANRVEMVIECDVGRVVVR